MHTKGCVCDICQRPELSRVVDDERRNWRNDEHDTQIMGAGFLFGGAGIGDGAGDKSLTEIGHVEALKAGDDGKRIGKGARGEEKGASQGGVGRPTWLRIWGTGRRTGPRGWFW